MATTTNVLITGPNRGIGNGLLTSYLTRPNHTVIAGVRNPSSSQHLQSIPKAANTTLIIVKIDNEDDSTAAAAISELKSTHNITTLDLVIANAGICDYFGRVSGTPPVQMTRHFQVNTIAPLVLFEAAFPLLEAATAPAKFVTISSAVGSMTVMAHIPFDCTPYGASKTAATYLVRKIHLENPGLIAFPIHPGWVQTEMGNAGAEAAGMAKAEITLKESVDGLMSVIDKATKEETSGNLMNYDGKVLPW
ncbi:aflatoxin biosynthesis ketoreductase nor-1 [Rhexocercosporidium sp. MPI-PUGE-AT-0058]|nr:aflatoxin biosynthesis ketoreductase nor-1 [Rhexocercosporidium sp. MPI-PUGE-AT-0058]